MATLGIEERNVILKLQAVLTKIDNKQPVFFNVAQYTKMGLIKECGTRTQFIGENRQCVTNWALTTKGKRILNAQI